MTDKRVRVRARVSFHDIRQGEEADVVLDDVMRGWIDGGFMEVIGGAEDEARSGGAEPDAPGRKPKRTRQRRAPDAEPGEALRPSEDGAVEGVGAD